MQTNGLGHPGSIRGKAVANIRKGYRTAAPPGFPWIGFLGWLLAGAAVAWFSYALQVLPIGWSVAITVGYVAATFVVARERQLADLSKEKADEAERHEQRHETRSIHLLSHHALAELHDIVLLRTSVTYGLRKELSDLEEYDINSLCELMIEHRGKESDRKGAMISEILSALCGKILETKAARIAEEGSYPHHYIKATFFERQTKLDESEILVRKYWKYPGGRMPRTTEIPKGSMGGLAGLAWEEMTTQISEDVTQDLRWHNFWPDQQKEYTSMICVPVIKDLRWYGVFELLGVLTIDTNLRAFFPADQNNAALIGDLLQPFCDLIALLYEMEALHQGLTSSLEQACVSSDATEVLATSDERA